jgi:hypothetical protein
MALTRKVPVICTDTAILWTENDKDIYRNCYRYSSGAEFLSFLYVDQPELLVSKEEGGGIGAVGIVLLPTTCNVIAIL